VQQGFITEHLDDGGGKRPEERDLFAGEIVVRGVLAGGEVGEDGGHAQGAVAAQGFQQFGHVSGHEAEAVHAGVQLDVYGRGIGHVRREVHGCLQ